MIKEFKTITEKLYFIQSKLSVKKNQKNKFGNYSYRTAEDIYTSFKEVVNKYDLNVYLITIFKKEALGARIFLECKAIIKDEIGEIEANSFAELANDKKGMDLAQLTGSTQTYARKYALQSLLAIDDKEMDLDSDEEIIEPEKNIKEDLPKYINDDSLKILQKLIDKEPKSTDGSIITALSICKNQEISSLKEITDKKFLSIRATLEKKIKNENGN